MAMPFIGRPLGTSSRVTVSDPEQLTQLVPEAGSGYQLSCSTPDSRTGL